ncbi:15923_t:CDS:2 [Acaulospora colombiana]|uniref:15923_t:CDS:1 n=1 Tax=Acaulospora colombiana TaxID=27376 RepID=A0ACA9PME4_9GLOM|nr:15923_t:CDS:2 [Acaulospora colombiana]
MVSSLIEHEQIQTTVAKAKEAARLAEKINAEVIRDISSAV